MPHLDQKERERLRGLSVDDKNTETNTWIHKISVAIHAGTLDKPTIDEALERITEMHVKPDDGERLGGPDKTFKSTPPAPSLDPFKPAAPPVMPTA